MPAEANVKRALAEVVGNATSSNAAEANVNRAVAEVVAQQHEQQFAEANALRAIAEVVAQQHEQHYAEANVIRALLEVPSSAARRGKGLNLPDIAVTNFTLFMMIRPVNWAAGSNHEFGLITDMPGHGVFIRQTDVANQVQILLRDGPTGIAQCLYQTSGINDKFILSFRYDSTDAQTQIRFNRDFTTSFSKSGSISPMAFKNLCGILEYNRKENGMIAEVVLYSNLLNNFQITSVENYLYCKWVSPGASEVNNFCIPV